MSASAAPLVFFQCAPALALFFFLSMDTTSLGVEVVIALSTAGGMVLVVPGAMVFVTSERTPVIPSKLCAISTVVEGFSEDGVEPTSKPLLVLGRAKPTFFQRFGLPSMMVESIKNAFRFDIRRDWRTFDNRRTINNQTFFMLPSINLVKYLVIQSEELKN